MRSWHPSDIILSRDGKIALTKVAAATFHLNIAIAVAYVTYKNGTFDIGMWTLYGTFAVGHAAYDKTSAQVKAFKDAKLEASAPPQA